MAKELPYFKFEPSEWITGNITLCSMEAQGLFINLCSYYWIKDGSISLTNAKQRFCSCDTLFDQLINNEIITLNNDDLICIKFLDEQRDKFIDIGAKRSEAGKSAWEAKAKQKPSKSQAKGDIYREDIDKNINISFDVFWNAYDKKVGNKKLCIQRWNKLKDAERQKIIDTLPLFITSIRDKQFMPYPEKYLNERRWENELPGVIKSSDPDRPYPIHYVNPAPDERINPNWK